MPKINIAKSFLEYKQKMNDDFNSLSNNYGVTLKFLAQHDQYGWEFHDRFLILIPTDELNLPEVYSLGTSINMLGKIHHTIRYELTAIRNSLKFRGVGVHPAGILLHPYRNFKLTLIPLLIRTVKISEEMAAAAMVRGVTADNTVISFERIQWRKRDTAASALGGSLFLALIIAERV